MIVLKEFEGINRNMRCIEIDYTDTINEEPLTINRNMRCIEIYILYHYVVVSYMINRNMRCIEMSPVVLTRKKDNKD